MNKGGKTQAHGARSQNGPKRHTKARRGKIYTWHSTFALATKSRRRRQCLHERTTKVTETDSSQLVAKRKQLSCSFPDFKAITSKHHAQLTFTRPMAITYYQYSQELRGFDKICSSSSSSRDGRHERSINAPPNPRQMSSKLAFVHAEHRRHAPTSTS